MNDNIIVIDNNSVAWLFLPTHYSFWFPFFFKENTVNLTVFQFSLIYFWYIYICIPMVVLTIYILGIYYYMMNHIRTNNWNKTKACHDFISFWRLTILICQKRETIYIYTVIERMIYLIYNLVTETESKFWW